ncbi:MAG: site-2 protease family protein [Candidatus Altiarchaeales archaeon ex4484_2]|nr:MAG: site-2 protease family protein [Candidatus Altiarchaeales archaeon ex4484_2]
MNHKRFTISPKELWELFTAWIILSIAFAILYANNDFSFFLIAFPVSIVAVGLGFVLHELGHKYLAQRYGLGAVFRANYQGLFFAILISFTGFILVAPGAVHLHGRRILREQHGKISLMGPLMNLFLALAFLMLYLMPFPKPPLIDLTAVLGFRINTWIGLFNLIPVSPFDGLGIKKWSLPVYLMMVLLVGTLFFSSYLVNI